MNTIVPDRVGIVDFEATGQRPQATAKALSSLHPLHDRVLVRRIEEPSKSSIIIPEVAKTKPLRGVVVAVGPGRKNSDGVFQETMVKPGDIVLFTASVDVPYADLVHDGDLVMMSEGDILGILS